ncbi:GNAT family N-acetyltransferase [Aliikangiella sp. IMCC44359]|uniref:GNAT family N-acetyltransferase n=1 Tax=Aliikangiella sp. IMCC44359 TaxID=3459125 RepID=UPI00403A8A10
MKLKFLYQIEAPNIYYCGWDELVESGLHPSLSYYDESELQHLIATHKGKIIGVLSYWIDDMIEGSDANVMMVYVDPKYRQRGISHQLHEEFKVYCKINSIRFISYAVNNKNKPMLAAHAKYQSYDKYTIFQYEV